jgi:hypothetical protein
MKVSELKNLIESVISKEVRNKIISESKEVYHIKCEGVPLGTFDSEEAASEALPSYKAKHDGELIIEKGQYESNEDMLDKLDEMNDQLEETENMENTQPMEGNEFSGALKAAKDAGDETFTVDGKEYNVEECWTKQMEEELVGGQKNLDKNHNGKIDGQDFKILKGKKEEPKEEEECDECGTEMVKESKKKKIRLKESELIKLINKMVTESIPGLDAVKNAHNADKETNQHLSDVEKKMKDSASFDGNDNPEFPKPIGKGEKVARQNTEKENEFVEDNRGGTLLNLDYNTEPSQQFKDRLKKALEGDATTGNSQDYANVIKSDTGKNLAKQAERKKKKKDAEFNVSWGHSWKSPEEVKVVNESKFKMSDVLNEEIKKMKDMVNYNKKTQ